MITATPPVGIPRRSAGVHRTEFNGAHVVPERLVLMAKHNDVRPIIKLRSTAGTGFTYVTRKNRRSDPDRLVMRKYDPVVRNHVDFREER
jgi:large subunit ribosomal protein L33